MYEKNIEKIIINLLSISPFSIRNLLFPLDEKYLSNYPEALASFSKTEILLAIKNLLSKKIIFSKESIDLSKDVIEISEIFLYLTPLGSNLWEDENQIDWNGFIDCFLVEDFSVEDSEIILEISSIDKDTLIKSIELSAHFIDEKNIKPIKDWYPVYWKKLPSGFCLKQKFIPKKRPELEKFHESFDSYLFNVAIKNLQLFKTAQHLK